MTFRETIHRLQASKLKLDNLEADSLFFASRAHADKQGKRDCRHAICAWARTIK